MKIQPVRVAFLDPATKKPTGLDLFGDAKAIQQRYGRSVHAKAVDQALDIYEAQMKKGVVYYDTRRVNPPVILHDRAALLQTFYRDGQIGRPA